jgi:hypothetical protein
MKKSKEEIDAESAERKAIKQFRRVRRTKLVRISTKWHRQLKMMEMKKMNTISQRIDYMCELFFKHNPELRVPESVQTAIGHK